MFSLLNILFLSSRDFLVSFLEELDGKHSEELITS